jgi:rubredoxin
MSIPGEIKQQATRIAVALHSQSEQLKTALTEIEARKASIAAALKAASLSEDRLMRFEPQIGRDFQCPRCWIEHEKRSVLSAIGGGTNREDFWRCSACGFEMSTAA